MKKIGSMKVVDMETGKVVEEKQNAFSVLPPKGDVCQECAVDHPWDAPHDAQSLHYQYHFYAQHGRWPTWSDAMGHCTPEVQAEWRTKLVAVMREEGLDVPDDLLDPKPAGR